MGSDSLCFELVCDCMLGAVVAGDCGDDEAGVVYYALVGEDSWTVCSAW